MNVHVEAPGQTCCHSLCWPPFFFFMGRKKIMFIVFVCMHVPWSLHGNHKTSFSGFLLNMYMNVKCQFSVGV